MIKRAAPTPRWHHLNCLQGKISQTKKIWKNIFRNKKIDVQKPEIISIDESQAEHELVRVTSQLTTVTQLTESGPEPTKSSTGSKLKRIISDPVQLTNPFTMSSVDPFQGILYEK